MKPTVQKKKRLSAVWIFPVVALLMGIWMVVHSFMTEGPTIEITFNTASGLEAGKTKIRLHSVVVGIVEEISLDESIEGVVVTAKLDLATKPLLREDTGFWVVRARVGAGGVSGLGTLLSGAYIELSPGAGAEGARRFTGLEEPPQTSAGAPGLRLTLVSQRSPSVSSGDAVLYNGYKVGRVESMIFDTESRSLRYSIFIDAPYHTLVDTATRFWDVSGISLDLSAEGFQLHTGSMDTLLLGGVAFGHPGGVKPGRPVTDSREFQLFDSFGSTLENPYQHGMHYVVAFDESIRGLEPGATVQYRGITIGNVERILLKELTTKGLGSGYGQDIPVLIYLEPARLEVPDSEESVERLRIGIEGGVANGLRATMQTGNLLTGKQYINFDYYPDAGPAELDTFDGHTVVPSIPTGIQRLEQQLGDFLKKLNSLPLEQTVSSANGAIARADTTMASLTETLESLDQLLSSNATQGIPTELNLALQEMRKTLHGFSPESTLYQDLKTTVRELNETLDNLKILTNTLSKQPNSLLFSPKSVADPVPEARP